MHIFYLVINKFLTLRRNLEVFKEGNTINKRKILQERKKKMCPT